MHTTGDYDPLLAEIIEAQVDALLARIHPSYPKASALKAVAVTIARQYKNAQASQSEWAVPVTEESGE